MLRNASGMFYINEYVPSPPLIAKSNHRIISVNALEPS